MLPEITVTLPSAQLYLGVILSKTPAVVRGEVEGPKRLQTD